MKEYCSEKFKLLEVSKDLQCDINQEVNTLVVLREKLVDGLEALSCFHDAGGMGRA